MVNYEQRITFFLDILGFRNIVSQTSNDEKKVNDLFCVLDTMKAEEVAKEIFVEINQPVVEDSEELEGLKELQREISEKFIEKSSISITHFSDSIVFSIGLENDMNAMSLIEYVGRLVYRLWRDFDILIRGGVSVDKLIHKENGPLYGPAMVKAYDYETNLANYPRIVMDNNLFNIVGNSPSFRQMKSLFIDFSDSKQVNGKEVSINKGLEINLATVFRHYLNSQLTFHPKKRQEVQRVINESIKKLEKNIEGTDRDDIKEKYKYLIDRIREYKLLDAK
tara:strand:- start:1263 stop:2099 length:837 start_codon:yes stop_codon:yes gene_type:complete